MSYWYWRQLKNAWPLEEVSTNRFDMPEQGGLSGLAIQSTCINTTATPGTADNPWPIQHHTKIRLVGNGNFEIVNTRAKYLSAITAWDWDVNPDGYYTQNPSNYQRNFWYIPFGRYMGDMKYGLKLENFTAGVQFEETNDFDITYFTDGSSTMNIFGLFRKNPEPSLFSGGYLRKREIINKAAASETQYGVKMPTENRLRQIHLFPEPTLTTHQQTTSITTEAQYVWLSIKSKEEYLIDNMRTIDLINHVHQVQNRKFITNVNSRDDHPTSSGIHYVDTMLYRRFNSVATPVRSSVYDGAVIMDWGDRSIARAWMHAGGAVTTAMGMNVMSVGYSLHGDIPLLLQNPMGDETEWIDAKANKDIYVEVTEGVSTGHWRIVLDELEKGLPQ